MDAAWIIPIVIVVLLIIGVLLFWQQATKANMDRYDGDVAAAMSDNSTPIPSTPLIPDDAELGDTTQAHDEISPHDLPPDHPGREAAEAEAQTEAQRRP
jgi:hypothetical protein